MIKNILLKDKNLNFKDVKEDIFPVYKFLIILIKKTRKFD